METSGFPMTHHVMHGFRSHSLALQDILAVGERFELSKGVNPCWFSRPVHSTALPRLLIKFIICYIYIRGEGGIRTRETLPFTRFPSALLQPLGHLSYDH